MELHHSNTLVMIGLSNVYKPTELTIHIAHPEQCRAIIIYTVCNNVKNYQGTCTFEIVDYFS